MLTELTKIIAGLFDGLDIRRRWLTILVIILGVMVIASAIEYVSGYNYFLGLERRITLLKELNELAKDGITTHPELNAIYESTIMELREREVHPFTIPIVEISSSVDFWKFFSGALVGLFFIVATLLGLIKVDDRRSTILGAIVIAIIFGVVGLALPIIVNPWINYIGMPIICVGAVLLFGRRTKKA